MPKVVGACTRQEQAAAHAEQAERTRPRRGAQNSYCSAPRSSFQTDPVVALARCSPLQRRHAHIRVVSVGGASSVLHACMVCANWCRMAAPHCAGTHGFVSAALAARLPEELRQDMQEQYPGGCAVGAHNFANGLPGAEGMHIIRRGTLDMQEQYRVGVLWWSSPPPSRPPRLPWPPPPRPGPRRGVGGGAGGCACRGRACVRPVCHLAHGQRQLCGDGELCTWGKQFVGTSGGPPRLVWVGLNFNKMAKHYGTGDSRVIPQHSTNPAQSSLTSEF